MIAAGRRGGWLAHSIRIGVLLLLAIPAHAAPLGLQLGDEITSISMDALHSVTGDGGVYDSNTGRFTADGRWTTVNATLSGALAQTGVDQHFELDFLSESLTPVSLPFVFFGESFLVSPGLQPDFVVSEGGANILFGNFVGNLRISGTINVNDPLPQSLSAIGRVEFTGGVTNLLAALGGVGGQANVLLSATLSDFDPDLLTLVGNIFTDGQIFNSDFNVSMSGSLIPLNSQPFVPEPSTALLMAAGLLGLLGASRRVRRHRS